MAEYIRQLGSLFAETCCGHRNQAAEFKNLQLQLIKCFGITSRLPFIKARVNIKFLDGSSPFTVLEPLPRHIVFDKKNRTDLLAATDFGEFLKVLYALIEQQTPTPRRSGRVRTPKRIFDPSEIATGSPKVHCKRNFSGLQEDGEVETPRKHIKLVPRLAKPGQYTSDQHTAASKPYIKSLATPEHTPLEKNTRKAIGRLPQLHKSSYQTGRAVPKHTGPTAREALMAYFFPPPADWKPKILRCNTLVHGNSDPYLKDMIGPSNPFDQSNSLPTPTGLDLAYLVAGMRNEHFPFYRGKLTDILEKIDSEIHGTLEMLRPESFARQRRELCDQLKELKPSISPSVEEEKYPTEWASWQIGAAIK